MPNIPDNADRIQEILERKRKIELERQGYLDERQQLREFHNQNMNAARGRGESVQSYEDTLSNWNTDTQRRVDNYNRRIAAEDNYLEALRRGESSNGVIHISDVDLGHRLTPEELAIANRDATTTRIGDSFDRLHELAEPEVSSQRLSRASNQRFHKGTPKPPSEPEQLSFLDQEPPPAFRETTGQTKSNLPKDTAEAIKEPAGSTAAHAEATAEAVSGGTPPPNKPPASGAASAAGNAAEEAGEKAFKEMADKGSSGFGKVLKGKKVFGIAGAIIAIGTAAYVVNKSSDKARERHQKRQQEQRQKREAKLDQKYKYAGTSIAENPTAFLPFQLWENRTGHHRMGNAKYF